MKQNTHTPGRFILATWHTDNSIIERDTGRTVTARELLESHDVLLAALAAITQAVQYDRLSDAGVTAHITATRALASARGEG